METLTKSSLKLFSEKYYRDKEIGFLSPRYYVLSRPEIRLFRPPPKLVNVSFLLSNPLPHKSMNPIFSVSSFSSSDTQTHLDNEEQQIEDQSKTVHVKFQLQRECSFGQQFLIVGADPMLGSWDPTNAVPMNWSVGHVWTVELDIPIEKPIKFKFLLKRGTEEFLWQPDPDRIIQTWETKKTITVCEDWENAELQKLIEDEPTCPKEDPIAISKKNMTTEGNVFGNNGSALNLQDLESAKDDGNLVPNEEVQVLIPGLMPAAHTANEAEETNFANASIGVDKANDLKVLELDLMEEPDSDSPHSKETEMMFNEEKEQDQRNTMPFDGILENDIKWGRRTLQKLLSNLGFL